MKRFVLVDIDHTIAHSFWRDDMIGKTPWEDYHEASQFDKPVASIVRLLRALNYSGYCNIVAVTGRTENFRSLTVNWLMKYSIPVDHLLMRPEGNFTKNADMKMKLVTDFFCGDFSALEFLIDDNENTILEFCKAGITTLQCRNVALKEDSE